MECEKTDLNTIDVTPEKDGGVIKEIKRHGEGTETPYLGDKVSVHYVGTLTDGSQFDSSRDRGEPFEFDIGKGNVIKAWDMGVATMKKGELATLTCQPKYAYGEHGSPPKIGKNATLTFEVELLSWEGEDVSEDKDKSVLRHQVRMGDGYQTPNEGGSVKIHLVGRYEGTIFEERDVDFVVGDGAKEGIVPGVDYALRKFKKGEHSKLEVKPSQAFGATGSDDFGIPPDAEVEYEVILNQFEKVKDTWEMDATEKIEQSEIVKAKGTVLFKEEKYEKAIVQYRKVVSYLEDESCLKEESDKTQRDALILAAYLNIAMCNLRLGDYKETRDNCEKALEIDCDNSKALYRRAQANAAENNYDLAITDYKHILQVEPDNKAAKTQLTSTQRKLTQFIGDQKKRYQGMFTKFAAEDAKKNPVYDFTKANVFEDVNDWDNSMADGMMSLEQEQAAFDDAVPNAPPPTKDHGDTNEGDDSANSAKIPNGSEDRYSSSEDYSSSDEDATEQPRKKPESQTDVTEQPTDTPPIDSEKDKLKSPVVDAENTTEQTPLMEQESMAS